MTAPITQRDLESLPPRLRLAFAPLDKFAAGAGVGVWAALAVFLVTAYHLLFNDYLLENVPYLKGADHSSSGLWLLANYFWRYSPETWAGAAIGGLWGLAVGFVFGWFLAFARNFFVACCLFTLRTREQLSTNRDFLDHL